MIKWIQHIKKNYYKITDVLLNKGITKYTNRKGVVKRKYFLNYSNNTYF